MKNVKPNVWIMKDMNHYSYSHNLVQHENLYTISSNRNNKDYYLQVPNWFVKPEAKNVISLDYDQKLSSGKHTDSIKNSSVYKAYLETFILNSEKNVNINKMLKTYLYQTLKAYKINKLYKSNLYEDEILIDVAGLIFTKDNQVYFSERNFSLNYIIDVFNIDIFYTLVRANEIIKDYNIDYVVYAPFYINYITKDFNANGFSNGYGKYKNESFIFIDIGTLAKNYLDEVNECSADIMNKMIENIRFEVIESIEKIINI